MRVIIPVMAGLGLVALAGCYAGDPYRDSAYRAGPATTTTTTVVRDGYGNPLSTAQTVRDGNGNAVSITPGVYQNGQPYYDNGPIYPAQPYRRY